MNFVKFNFVKFFKQNQDTDGFGSVTLKSEIEKLNEDDDEHSGNDEYENDYEKYADINMDE